MDRKNTLMAAFLKAAPFDGWNDKTLENAAISAGLQREEAYISFPQGAEGVAHDYFDHINCAAKAEYDGKIVDNAGVRDRVTLAIRIRLDLMEKNREAVRTYMASRLRPDRMLPAATLFFGTIDRIWKDTGDASADFNYYTKRLTLAGVYASTVVFWLNDASEDYVETMEFLQRRMKDVMTIKKCRMKVESALLIKGVR